HADGAASSCTLLRLALQAPDTTARHDDAVRLTRRIRQLELDLVAVPEQLPETVAMHSRTVGADEQRSHLTRGEHPSAAAQDVRLQALYIHLQEIHGLPEAFHHRFQRPHFHLRAGPRWGLSLALQCAVALAS